MQRGGYEGVSTTQDAQIVLQPLQQESWMSIPVGIPNCPSGLEYLTAVDQLLIKQQKELLEAFTGFETKNKYKIKNALGQNVYFAIEDTDCCSRNCFGRMRPFDMQILDNFQNEVMHLYRPFRCDNCFFPCYLQEMEVSSPPGTVIGSIEQEWSFLRPLFIIKNAVGEIVLRISGPLCPIRCFNDVDFKILTLNGNEIGKISKQWSGLGKELFTDADHFGVTFPLDLDVRMKAVITAATFLIDMMYFEHN